MTTLMELKASAAEVRETLHIKTVALWESGKKKTTVDNLFQMFS